MMAKQISQEQVQTRKEMKKKKREKTSRESKAQTTKRIRIRLIPIWLRVLIVGILIALSLATGLMVGYGVIGDGNPTDVFQKSTWTHIIDLVIKN
ncbi:DNA-directed RNA polymerase subunit beta [Bacillus sp. FJAT-50079]|uniref:DNA-directed RNA polymerase subunit beta n=1 Tax=Bacillus sp. FJAT-50079 TaxID=2833577 RepID=UPI001BC9C550|nr:DNA-directed RNA polymerase subunit beta [Bacillus sp. FJAT-50079]MBS4206778.1 DNA-directed RNA polymerase subunit beta [Bacillus sp. FJAT-50079]